MMKAIAVDDEPLALEVIQRYCEQLEIVQLNQSFSNLSAAFKYLNTESVNLLFLDIHMPAMNGIDFFKSLGQKPLLILTTSHSEYALESYELNAVDYLLKPFSYERFNKAVLKAQQQIEHLRLISEESEKYLILKADYGIVKLDLAEVLFIEGLDNYLKIYLEGKPPLVVRYTLKSILGLLNGDQFIRVHRSYIVPLKRIEFIKHKIITIGCEEIPIGKSYVGDLKAALSCYGQNK